ncbi:MAG: hypothetical protein JWO94_1681 [Verrucomicrobiaceae bacterium]|nr:hypothetical protein [Verrucomicrobiaceae bacterium]
MSWADKAALGTEAIRAGMAVAVNNATDARRFKRRVAAGNGTKARPLLAPAGQSQPFLRGGHEHPGVPAVIAHVDQNTSGRIHAALLIETVSGGRPWNGDGADHL